MPSEMQCKGVSVASCCTLLMWRTWPSRTCRLCLFLQCAYSFLTNAAHEVAQAANEFLLGATALLG